MSYLAHLEELLCAGTKTLILLLNLKVQLAAHFSKAIDLLAMFLSCSTTEHFLRFLLLHSEGINFVHDDDAKVSALFHIVLGVRVINIDLISLQSGEQYLIFLVKLQEALLERSMIGTCGLLRFHQRTNDVFIDIDCLLEVTQLSLRDLTRRLFRIDRFIAAVTVCATD